jgi:hypothetical protein
MTILLCTSHRPSPRTRTFCNDLATASRDFEYRQRGKTPFIVLSAQTYSTGTPRMWVIKSRFGEPNLIECFDTTQLKAEKLSSLLLSRVNLRRERGLTSKKIFGGSLRIAPPEQRELKELYGLLLKSVGPPCGGGRITELRILRSEGHAAELDFINRDSGEPCGPRMTLKDYR